MKSSKRNCLDVKIGQPLISDNKQYFGMVIEVRNTRRITQTVVEWYTDKLYDPIQYYYAADLNRYIKNYIDYKKENNL